MSGGHVGSAVSTSMVPVEAYLLVLEVVGQLCEATAQVRCWSCCTSERRLGWQMPWLLNAAELEAVQHRRAECLHRPHAAMR